MIYKLAPHIHFLGHNLSIQNHDIKEIIDFFSDYDIITLVVHSAEITKEGYSSFVKECEKHSTQEKLIIPCLEDESKSYHILLIGTKTYTQNIYDPKREYLTVLAHPWGYAYHARKIKKKDLNLEELDGIEVWNLLHNSKKYPSLKTFKFFQELPKHIKAYIGIDEHPPFKNHDALMLVKCENLKKGSVLNALRKGRFYSKIKDFTITSQGELKKYEKKLNTYTKMKCLIRESTIHTISFLAVLGNTTLKRLGVAKDTRHKIKKIINGIRKNI